MTLLYGMLHGDLVGDQWLWTKPIYWNSSPAGRTVRLIRGPGGVVRRANFSDELRDGTAAVKGNDASSSSEDDDEDDDQQNGAGSLHRSALLTLPVERLRIV